jgi:chromosome partitioning protein
MIYVFANEKGGVGKSTLATSLAIYLHDCGRKVAVLDTDKQLHTARAVKCRVQNQLALLSSIQHATQTNMH